MVGDGHIHVVFTFLHNIGLDACSESSYRNIVASIPNLKKPRKATDMCPICVEGRKCKNKLQQLEKRTHQLTSKEKEEVFD
jgi:hypothetical protein